MQGHKDTAQGRRALPVPQTKQHNDMLRQINKSLSHLHAQEQQQFVRVDQRELPDHQWQHHAQNSQLITGEHRQDLGVHADLAQSSPNLAAAVERSNSTSSRSGNRVGYNRLALAQIKNSLQPFKISGDSYIGVGGSQMPPNGYSVDHGPVNENFVKKLMSMGFNEDLARQAVRISGNRCTDAALQVIQAAQQSEGRNGFLQMGGMSDFRNYGSKVLRKPSFEEKYRTDSPVNSENSSIRSESPAPYHMYVDSQAGLLTTNQQHLQYREQLGYFDGGSNTTLGSGIGLQNGHGQAPLQTSGWHPGDSRPGSGLLPPDHVQQMMRRRPHLRDSGLRPHSAQSQAVFSNGPIAAQHTVNSMYKQASQVPAPQGALHVATALEERTAPSRLHGGRGTLYGYSGASKSQPNLCQYSEEEEEDGMHLGYPNIVASMAGLNLGYPHDDMHSMASSLSPVSGHHEPSRFADYHPKPVPVSAWSTRQPQITLLTAQSQKIQKPVLQTATVPMAPSKCAAGSVQPGTTFIGGKKPPNYVSSVQAQVNTPADPAFGQNLQQLYNLKQPSSHHNNNNIQLEIRRTESSGGGVGSTQMPGAPNGGRTIQIQIQNTGSNDIYVHQHAAHQRHDAPESGFSSSGGGGVYTGSTNSSQLQLHPRYHMAFGTPVSTPGSESPIPRASNHSPVSVISTTSTPSTNSDRPERPPPPYPGNQSTMVSPAQLMQLFPDQLRYVHPYVDDLADTYSATSETPSIDSVPLDCSKDDSSSSVCDKDEGDRTHCTSPKPELSDPFLEQRLEGDDNRIKRFSSAAYKFYMEQHVENLFKSVKERDKRRQQLEEEMSKVGLNEDGRKAARRLLKQKETNFMRLKRAKMNVSMFTNIKKLGTGAFGEVALVMKNDTKQLYAMKTLRKNDVYRRNQVAHVKAERDILSEADNEWVVKLYYSFQDMEMLYFVMDYIPGGDMMNLLIKEGIFQEDLARFYVAELVLAIESVHKMNFIHRDIKPDNILIDKDGHIKLTDFGLCTGFRWTHDSEIYHKGNHARQHSMEPWEDPAVLAEERKILADRGKSGSQQRHMAHSLVGTPNYIAPEVLEGSGYTKCCDWWSVGVILYEMLVGQPPFLADTGLATQQKVINWERSLRIPVEAQLSQEAKDLITQLCCGADRRLGQNGAQEIKSHPFFRCIQFEGLRDTAAPYKPMIRFPTDTSNFDPMDSEKLAEGEKDSSLENGKHPEHAFLEFTFRRFFDGDGHAYAQKVQDPESNSPVYV